MIFIALGANLSSIYGSPEDTLYKSVEAIAAQGIDVVSCSSVWLTAPVPVSDQPWYRNAVICIETSHSPFELIRVLHSIEDEFGRVRGERNAPRVLDLDLIAYNDQIINEGGFFVPHPRAHERAFVLRPLAEIAPDWVHPVLQLPLHELLLTLPGDQDAVRGDKLVA